MTRHLTTEELAERLGESPRSLERWRRQGKGPRFLPLFKGIRYRVADVEEWERSRLVDPAKTA